MIAITIFFISTSFLNTTSGAEQVIFKATITTKTKGNHPPTIKIKNNPSKGYKGKPVTFTFIVSDEDGNLNNIDIDCNGDKTRDNYQYFPSGTSYKEVSLTCTYYKPGNYHWTATAYDKSGKSSKTLSGSIYIDVNINTNFCSKENGVFYCKVPIKFCEKTLTVVFKYKEGSKVYKKECYNYNEEKICYTVPDISNIETVYIEGMHNEEFTDAFKELFKNQDLIQNFISKLVESSKNNIIEAAFLRWYLYEKFKTLFTGKVNDSYPKLGVGDHSIIELTMLKGYHDNSLKNSIGGINFVIDNLFSKELWKEFQYKGGLREGIESIRNVLIPIADKLGVSYTKKRMYIQVENSKILKEVEELKKFLINPLEVARTFVELELKSNEIRYRLSLLKDVFEYNGMPTHLQKAEELINLYNAKVATESVEKCIDYLLDITSKEFLFKYLELLDIAYQSFLWEALIAFHIGLLPDVSFIKVAFALADIHWLSNLQTAINNYVKHKFYEWVNAPPEVGEVADVLELIRMSKYIEVTEAEKVVELYNDLGVQILIGISELVGNSGETIPKKEEIENLYQTLDKEFSNIVNLSEDDFQQLLNKQVSISLVASPNTGVIPLTVSFSCKLDNNHNPTLTYKWDFNGDGIIDEITTWGETTYTYDKAGIYNATVSVTDNNGNLALISTIISVTTHDNSIVLHYQKGWNLKGSSHNISIPADKRTAITVWVWRNGKWYVWSGNEQIINLIQKYGIPFLSEIKAGEGFWINVKQDTQFEVRILNNSPFQKFNLNEGWNLVGTSYPLKISSFNKPEVLMLWKWTGNSWQFWSPNPSLMKVAQTYGLDPITEIDANDGFWVKASAQVNISVPVEETQ